MKIVHYMTEKLVNPTAAVAMEKHPSDAANIISVSLSRMLTTVDTPYILRVR
jgi:hypothetical protein